LGLAAYSNSFHGPLIFDDNAALRDNPQIRGIFAQRAPDQLPDAISARPLLVFAFKLNYLIGRLQVEGYHIVNVIIHLAVGLLLYAIVRRTLDNSRFAATWLATAVAAIWIVHPLNTEAVTYIVQRSESLAALFYLLCIYCLIRAAQPRTSAGIWSAAAVAACALGMATKEVVVTAPLMAILYDRTFLAGSFARALRLRRWLYLGLAATWIITLFVVLGERRSPTIGFHVGISPLQYAATELNVIAHYFWLAFWPHPLALDYYDWPVVRSWADIGWGGWAVAALAIAVIIALWKKPWLGFLGAWIFLILSPSSSVVPLVSEIAAERRMYLPLMALTALVVVGGWTMLGKFRLGKIAAITAACAIALVLGDLTWQRNQLYGTEIDIMRDAAEARPNNPRALYNDANALAAAGYSLPEGSSQSIAYAGEAALAYRRSIQAQPNNYLAWDRLGLALLETKDWHAAQEYYTYAIDAYPPFAAEAYMQRGKLRVRRNDLPGAIADFHWSIALRPDNPDAHYFLAVALSLNHDWPGAESEYERTLSISPNFKDTRARLAGLLKRIPPPTRPAGG
jgi:hypothetical protein